MTTLAPLYAQVSETLRARLDAGRLAPGVQLPSERTLCEEFGVSSITMRRALATLVAEGRLVRHQGRGTFVVDQHHLVLGPPVLSSFSADLAQRGWGSTSHVLQLETLPGPEKVTARLGLSAGASVTVLRRVRLADDAPIAIQTAWLPAKIFPGLERVDTFEAESLYAVLLREFAIAPAHAVETFTATQVDASDAGLLDVTEGSPAFEVERLTTDRLDRRIEVVESVIRGDRYSLVVNLHAGAA